METRFYHGQFTPQDLAQALVGYFHGHRDWQVQQIGEGEYIVVQIATRQRPSRGGRTALSVSLQQVTDGVAVQMGQQEWQGLAADLGLTALLVLRNPWSLLGRLDDLAQDVALLSLADQVWEVLDVAVKAWGGGMRLSERLRRVVCAYCGTANEVGKGRCVACGAPLGTVQPRTCPHCGFVVQAEETVCPNCGQKLT
ncbi:MAG TPA: zinc ribbon domain-containing protein [Anaerolineae bacterium]|nr:zinc ribbon domain-containing protein [Anaerolineae bacterium]HID83728.1 zinc ribbon domain-containing protein [Anaerolineales bacterium]HIQ08647.1 zinc ribbon domain-containing protein [Anaerolineaceae bacterium]